MGAGRQQCAGASEALTPRTSSASPSSAGDPLPANCELIEVHVSELKQLFNAIDPSPFRERDLDPNAEEFITNWAKEASPSANFGLAVYLDRPAGLLNEPEELREAIHEFFRHRAELSRRRMRELLRRGRTSLVIGLCALGVSLAAGNLVGEFFSNHIAGILREGLLIGGWVAMWRPMEIFLYDWWPIKGEALLADRLSVMPVRIRTNRMAAPTRGGGIGRSRRPRLERFTANPSKVPKLIAYRHHHLTIGRGVSGCFKSRSIVS